MLEIFPLQKLKTKTVSPFKAQGQILHK